MGAREIYTRQAAGFRNELRHSCAALVGIVQGIMADGVLHDTEVKFLNEWLDGAGNVASVWPGSAIHAQIRDMLADGEIAADEREHLWITLQKLVGGTLDELAESRHVSELPLDDLSGLEMADRSFCFTGDFVYGPRGVCESAVHRRGGLTVNSVSKKLNYLVVGGLGSPEWKHGSFGTKIEKAINYKRAGVPLMIVHEDIWASSLGH